MNSEDFAHSIEADLAKLEAARQAIIAKRTKGFLAIALVVAVTLIFGLFGTSQGSPTGFLIPLFFGLIGIAICFFVFFSNGASTYRRAFKYEVVARMAKSLAPNVIYQPSRMVDSSWFKRSGLFSGNVARYSGEDYFAGRIDKTDLFFSEIHAESKHTRTDANGHTHTDYKTIFKGLFLVADFHKEFQNEVFIQPDILEKFGFLGRKIQGLGGKVERMENPEFERLFKVTASNPVEARYILTPVMQERLVELARIYSPQIRVSFRASMVFLAIPNTVDWFEANLKSPANNSAQLQTIINQLRACFGLVEQLDLNTRIWTKE